MLSRRSLVGHLTRAVAAGRLSVFSQGTGVNSFSDADKEKFMLTAKIVSATEIGHGVTKPVKVKLELNGVTHDAKIQVVDKEMPDFFGSDRKPVPMRDSWKCNIAAYKVDRLLNLNMVTPEVQRVFKGKPAAFSWWVDDVMFEEVDRIKKDAVAPDPEAFERQRAVSRVFDELIMNIDRNLANLLITKSWKLALIDHSRSFTAYKGIRNEENLTKCSRSLMDAMKKLKADAIAQATGSLLTAAERDAILIRRDRILEFFQKRIAENGEQNVLFD